MTVLFYYRQHTRPRRAPEHRFPEKRKRRVFAVKEEAEASREIDHRDLSFDLIREKEKAKRAKRRRKMAIVITKLFDEGLL